MVDKEFVPCFFTGGYTEAGELQQFLRKINDGFSYRQCFPNKTKKKKGTPKKISSEFNGLTGDSLIEKVVEILERHKTDEEYATCEKKGRTTGKFYCVRLFYRSFHFLFGC